MSAAQQLRAPDPVHYLITVLARCAANLVRLRSRVVRLRNQAIDEAERRGLCGLAQKILDSDLAIYRHPDLQRFRWQVQDSFLWDALICMVTSLAQPGFFAQGELDSTWAKMAEVWKHHPELLSAGRPMQLSAGKAVLEAWAANPPSNCEPEPTFIATLRAKRSKPKKALESCEESEGTGAQENTEDETETGLGGSFGGWDVSGLEGINSRNVGVAMGDWVFWDQFFLDGGHSNV